MRILIITAVPREAQAIDAALAAVAEVDYVVVAGGVGRTNAAAATTEALLRQGPFDAVLNAGVAGALPGSGLAVGDAIIAVKSVYMEEGLIEPGGFRDMESLGFPLGDFAGNGVPADTAMLTALHPLISQGLLIEGNIATVATCSGTDGAADGVVARTGALAEAMEGAAVVHTAGRFGVPGMELRVISNTTGDRTRQQWDLDGALKALGAAVTVAVLRFGEVFPGIGRG